jgi:carboxyl-terminal processing protease
MQYTKTMTRRFVVLLFILALLLPGTSWAVKTEDDFESNRAMLLGYILRQYISSYHYSNKPFDDQVSRAAFEAYLQQLDFQKRFLLQKDIERLRTYSTKIDDEMNKGKIELPSLGTELLRARILFIQKQLPALLATPFDFQKDDYLELDPAKLGYCKSEQELLERWRQNLKFQVGKRYLDLLEEAGLKEQPLKSIDAAKRLALREQARQKIMKNNEDHLTRLLEDTEKEHFNRYFNAVAKAFDPHTLYMPPVSKEDFDIHMRGSLEGIGARLREEDGFIKVESIVPGSAAFKQGQLAAEDVILKVAEKDLEPVDITDMRLRDAVGLIRGEKGSEVRLTVRKPDNTTLVIPIIRDVVEIEETFVKSALFPSPDGEGVYGYIKIPSFYRDFDAPQVVSPVVTEDPKKKPLKLKLTDAKPESRNVTDDTRKAVQELKAGQMKGLVLDLRDNSGGSLNDAVLTAGLFIKQGPVVQVREGRGKVQTLADNGGKIEYDGPLVVLVNRFSASASEIVAGALQDYGRAVVIGGDHTHGKGTVQAVIDLDRGVPSEKMEQFKPLGALKITTQKFYRISGESTQYRGVVPDIILPDWFSGMESGEQYLENSLPWDTISPVPYDKWQKEVAELALLQKRSNQRVAASADFTEIRQRVERAQVKRQETLQPLQLEKMRQQRQQDEAERQFFSRMHAHGEESENGNGKAGKAARRNSLSGLKEDPYVQEAVSILKDISFSRSGMLAEQPLGVPSLSTAAP